jgi:hypothetical protein
MATLNDNTSILNHIARDIGTMKNGIVKLVSIQTETSRSKADKFFADQSRKESDIESRYGRRSTSPTVSSVKGGGGKGGGGSVMDSIKGFLNFLLKAALGAGAVLGISKLLDNPEIRNTIKNFIKDVFFGVVNMITKGAGILSQFIDENKDDIGNSLLEMWRSIKKLIITGIEGLGNVFSNKEFVQGIVDIATAILKAIWKVVTTEIEVGGIKTSLGVVIAGVVGTFLILKRALNNAANAIADFATGVNRSNGRSRGRSRGRSSGGRLGGVGLVGSAILAAEYGIPWFYDKFVKENGREPTEEEIANAKSSGVTPSSETKQNSSLPGEMAGKAVAGGIALADAARRLSDLKGARVPTPAPTPSAGKPLTSFGSVGEGREMAKNKSVWAKFLAYVEKKAPKLFAKIGARLAGAGVLATIPIIGWIGAAIEIGFGLWTAYELYELWKEYSNLPDDDRSPTAAQTATPTTPTAPANMSNTSSPTPGQDPFRDAMVAGARGSGGDMEKGLLDLVAQGESASSGNYNAMNQGTRGNNILGSGNSEKIIGKKLTEMTVGDIMKRGELKVGNEDRVFAAGRYQIIPDTLKGLVAAGVVSPNDRFDEATQDRLGMALLQQRGLNKFKSGEITAEQFQNNLASEWGSLANTSGKSSLGGPNVAMKGSGEKLAALLGGKGGATPTPALASAKSSGSSTETKLNTAADSAAALIYDQVTALDKLMGGQLMKGSVKYADMLRDITKEFMNNPTFVDSSTNVNNSTTGQQDNAVTASTWDKDVLSAIMDRRMFNSSPLG